MTTGEVDCNCLRGLMIALLSVASRALFLSFFPNRAFGCASAGPLEGWG